MNRKELQAYIEETYGAKGGVPVGKVSYLYGVSAQQ